MIPSPIYKEIGAFIKAKRKKMNMRQKNLAAAVGISRGSLANIETGRQNMFVHQLYNFARVLELSPAELLPPPPGEKSNAKRTRLPLPNDLKPGQKEQVTRLFLGTTSVQKKEKEVSHVKHSSQ